MPDAPPEPGAARRPPPPQQRASKVVRDKYYGYKESLRQYAAILYRRHPPGFALFLRGQQVQPRHISPQPQP